MRKSPIEHVVRPYKRKDGTHVNPYVRGEGYEKKVMKSRMPPIYLEPRSSVGKRWEQIADDPDYQWRSTENPAVTVNVNLEEMENDLDYEEDSPDAYKVYLVFPSYNHRGIPSSPDQYSEGTSGNIESAKKEAIDMAKKIMKLPIEKIERFDWKMVD